MAIKDVESKCWILALFVRDDGERFLLGDGNYEFNEKQLHFAANKMANDVVEVQGNDGYLLAGQVRRPSAQSFDGYVGDSSTSKAVVEQRRRAFFEFFRKGFFYKVVYVFPDGSAIQRKRGFLVDAPEVKELYQIYPEYHVALNFEDINYYYYDEDATGQEIYGESATIRLNSGAQGGGLVWLPIVEGTLSGEGTEFTLYGTSLGVRLNSAELKGDTVQNGNPTPSNPIAIQTTTGSQTITVSNGSESQEYVIDLGDIELCKLDDYQDRIYKSGDDWYIHKEIKKLDVSSLTGWFLNNNTNFRTTSGVSDLVFPLDNNTVGTIMSDYFSANTANNLAGGTVTDYGIALGAASYISIRNKDLTTVTALTNYLANNQIYAYVALATPTDSQITDAPLIAQLDALAAATTYDGSTSFTVDGDGNLAATLSVEVDAGGDAGVQWDENGAVWEEGGSASNTIMIDSIDNVYPVLTITGRTVNPVITDVTTGLIFQYTGTITESQTLVVDMMNKTATLNGVSVVGNVTGDWLYLAPGSNRLTYVADNTNAPNATLEWQEIVG